jgi:mannosylglucosylglycerate synthase
MSLPRVAILHYSAPPVIGGVEAVMDAHVRILRRMGYPVTVIAGRGNAGQTSMDGNGDNLVMVPEMDTQHPEILRLSAELDQGRLPEGFAAMQTHLADALRPLMRGTDVLMAHNVLFKHFNLPLTAALFQLLEEGEIRRCLAWGHDFSWTSPNSRSKVYEGFPWDLLRRYQPGVCYVAVSEQRRDELAGLLGVPPSEVDVIYNGVDPENWYGLSAEGGELVRRMDLLPADLVLLMPVRVTTAKNIEFAQQVVAALKGLGLQPRLVVTGPPDPHHPASMAYYHSLLAMREELGLRREVRFVFESGPDEGLPYSIGQQVVSELVRIADVMFMPSRREGFGMPVLEAGLLGVPVVCSRHVPAALEIAPSSVTFFEDGDSPEQVARLLAERVSGGQVARLRRQVRQQYTWEQLFHTKIKPYLGEE